VRSAGHRVVALEAVIASAVPRRAGLSSSASLELAFAAAWQAAGRWTLPPLQLALLCQRDENNYVCVNCGIIHQATSACAEAGKVLLPDCRTLHYRTVALPKDVLVVVADSGVRHALSVSAYNDRRAACEEAVRLLSADLPGIEALRDVDVETFDRLSGRLPTQVEVPARHVVEEIDRTRRAAAMLEAGDVTALGVLMNECHASRRDLYEVSCPELDALAELAPSLDECYGARLTGAGFGGCTVNLVEAATAEPFAQELPAAYRARTERTTEIYLCSPSAGASVVSPVPLP
jgi:galactokinase